MWYFCAGFNLFMFFVMLPGEAAYVSLAVAMLSAFMAGRMSEKQKRDADDNWNLQNRRRS